MRAFRVMSTPTFDIHHRLDQHDAEGRHASGYLGTYPGDTEAAALDAAAQDRGYDTWAGWPDAPEVVATKAA